MPAPWWLGFVLVLAVACGSSTQLDQPIIDRAVAAQDQAINLTLEEAGFLASGTLIEIYGLAADPVPVAVESQVVEYQGQQVWLLDITADLDDNGQRVQHNWRMWIGTPADGPPATLRAQRGP